MKKQKHLTIEEFKEKMDTHANYILVDVLPKDDYTHAHIKGAINIPLDDLETKANEWLNRHIDIIVYSANAECKGAKFAQEKLGQMGFRCWTVEGGLEAWEKENYPMEGDPHYKPHMTTERPEGFEHPAVKEVKAPEKEENPPQAEAPKKKAA